MKSLDSEKGYVLIVVLLLVVLILGSLTTFMTSSISNAKQEELIDDSNLATRAAEMGVEFYSLSMMNKFYSYQNDLILFAENEINNILENSEFNEEKKMDVQGAVLDELENEFDELIDYLYKNENTRLITEKYRFRLPKQTEDREKLKIVETNSNNEIIISGDVIGENTRTEEVTFLNLEQTFTIPDFVSLIEDLVPDGNREDEGENIFDNLRTDCQLPTPSNNTFTGKCLFESFDTKNRGNNYKIIDSVIKVDGKFKMKNSLEITDSTLYINGSFEAGRGQGHGARPQIDKSKICVNGELIMNANFDFYNSSHIFVYHDGKEYENNDNITYVDEPDELALNCGLVTEDKEYEKVFLPELHWENPEIYIEY